MGTFDGHLLAREGSSMTLSDRKESQVNAYAQTWQVQENEDMLFQSVRQPLAGQQCRLPNETKAEKQRRLGESLAAETANRACAHLDGAAKENCVFDVLAVGDVDIAKAGVY